MELNSTFFKRVLVGYLILPCIYVDFSIAKRDVSSTYSLPVWFVSTTSFIS